jgi:hypothetical protein
MINTISLTVSKRCDIKKTMSRRKLGNLLKRKLSFSIGKWFELKEARKDDWSKRQLQDFSRLGGRLIVMRMG